uniref:Neuronal membrane glycoprotein M6-a n=1 Tax=Echeneis naucrates TaxID=173247 RepID=A0A665UP73_ECHNA
SLIATILLYMGVALFCGCGHEALSGTFGSVQMELLIQVIDILKYIIYGLAAGFFVFGILLLVEGFFTTGAIRDLYGEFKITACGRCLTAFVRKHSRSHDTRTWTCGQLTHCHHVVLHIDHIYNQTPANTE